MPLPSDHKTSLRTTLLARRAALSAQERIAAEKAIHALLLERMQKLPRARVIGGYWPMRGEVDIRPILHELSKHWTVALPVAIADRPLSFLRWTPEMEMRQDRFGAGIPDSHDYVLPDCLIVPCLGIDARGYRLGYGGGFYDRTLASHSFQNRVLGITFSCCLIPEMPAEAHDKRLNYWITEAGLHQATRSDIE